MGPGPPAGDPGPISLFTFAPCGGVHLRALRRPGTRGPYLTMTTGLPVGTQALTLSTSALCMRTQP